MLDGIHFALLAGLLIFSVLALFLEDMLRAAVSLAVASVFLGLIFFRMQAPYAGVFEISVVAGLIMVLFFSTIILTRNACEWSESRPALFLFPVLFAVFIAFDIMLLQKIAGTSLSLPGSSDLRPFGEVLWNERTYDLAGQIGVILAGVAAVLILFRNRGKDE